MADVFVSYSRKDSGVVFQIVSRLIDLGFKIWIDRANIKGGTLWRAEIVEAIDNARAFVIILSPNSVKSENVRKEIDLAESSKCKLFPVRLTKVTLPAKLRYQLAGIQLIDYGSDPEGKFKELVEVLRAHLRNVSKRRKKQPTRQAELVIRGVNLERFDQKKQEKLLKYVAKISSTPRADLSLVKLSAGSVHAFIRMSAHSAYVLKTAALNGDRRLIKQGIDAMRLDGDQDFIQINVEKHSSEMNAILARLIERSKLSQTQINILRLDQQGWSSDEIARELGINVEAVYTRRSETLAKLARARHVLEQQKSDEEDLSAASGYILEVFSREMVFPAEIDKVSGYLEKIFESLFFEANKTNIKLYEQHQIKKIIERIREFRKISPSETRQSEIEREKILSDLQRLFRHKQSES